MAEHGVAALSHRSSGERVRTGPADPSGAWDQEHSPSTATTTQESGLRENRTSRLSERTEEGRQPDLLRLYRRGNPNEGPNGGVGKRAVISCGSSGRKSSWSWPLGRRQGVKPQAPRQREPKPARREPPPTAQRSRLDRPWTGLSNATI